MARTAGANSRTSKTQDGPSMSAPAGTARFMPPSLPFGSNRLTHASVPEFSGFRRKISSYVMPAERSVEEQGGGRRRPGRGAEPLEAASFLGG
jgi:hypothetical protein